MLNDREILRSLLLAQLAQYSEKKDAEKYLKAVREVLEYLDKEEQRERLCSLPSLCWILSFEGAFPKLTACDVLECTFGVTGEVERVRVCECGLPETEASWHFVESPEMYWDQWKAKSALESALQALHPGEYPCSGCRHMLGCGPTKMSTNYWHCMCPDKEV